jgi:hypothetical protein
MEDTDDSIKLPSLSQWVRGAGAMIVASLRESDLYISLMAIDSSVRGSWLYTLLVYEVLKAARKDLKLTTWSFKTNPGIHRGILNFAKTMEADHIGDEYTWEFPLED